MRFTASIVTHSTPLDRVYKALGCLLESKAEKIHIIDNSPGNELEAQLAHLGEIFGKQKVAGRIVYEHVENRGFGAAHNIAMREAISNNPGGAHLIMNPDVYWTGDAADRMASYLKEHPDVGIVAPKVFYPDGELQFTCRRLPKPSDVMMKRFLPNSIVKSRMEKYLLAAHDHDRELNCPYLQGSCMMLRNEALSVCGLFDERFFMYPEDIDLTRRIHGNWKTMYWPGASVVHEHAAASRHDMRMLRIHIANMARYFNKWGWITDRERKEINRSLANRLIARSDGKLTEGRG